MIYYVKLNDNILLILPWQNERQRSVNDFWSCINGNLLGDWLRPFINWVVASFIYKKVSPTLPARFWNCGASERQRFFVS